jgi:hypothetical protein
MEDLSKHLAKIVKSMSGMNKSERTNLYFFYVYYSQFLQSML